jgi:hypothetical protein
MWKVEWKIKNFHVTIYFESLHEKMINRTCVARDKVRKNGHMVLDILFEFLDLFNHMRYIFLLPHLEQHHVSNSSICSHCCITSTFKLSIYTISCFAFQVSIIQITRWHFGLVKQLINMWVKYCPPLKLFGWCSNFSNG